MTETLGSDFKNAEQKYGTYADDYTPHVEFLANRIIQLDQEKKLSPAYFLGAHMMLIADAITSAIAIKSETVHLEETRGFIKNCVKCVSDRNTQGVILDKIRKNIEDQNKEEENDDFEEITTKTNEGLRILGLTIQLQADLESDHINEDYFEDHDKFPRTSTVIATIDLLVTNYFLELSKLNGPSYGKKLGTILLQLRNCLNCVDKKVDIFPVTTELLKNHSETLPPLLINLIKEFEFNAPEEKIMPEKVIEKFKSNKDFEELATDMISLIKSLTDYRLEELDERITELINTILKHVPELNKLYYIFEEKKLEDKGMIPIIDRISHIIREKTRIRAIQNRPLGQMGGAPRGTKFTPKKRSSADLVNTTPPDKPAKETPKIPIKKEELRKDFQKKLKQHLSQNLDIGSLTENSIANDVYTLKDIESLLKTWHKSEKKKSGLKRKISLALETHFPAEY